MKKIKVVLMGNGSPDNGGCEAITKGTKKILEGTFQEVTIEDCYFDYTGKYGDDAANNVFPVRYPKRWTLKWFFVQIAQRISDKLTAKLLYSSHRKKIASADVVLSLGGDNYSLDYGVPRRFLAMGRYVRRLGTPFVIWGASIGPFIKGSAFERKLVEHLRNDVNLILLREDESLHYLNSIGVSDNVRMVADPAFMMEPEVCDNWYGDSAPNKYVCVNFSDLMAKYVTDGDLEKWKSICADIVNKLCGASPEDCLIVFIPHVKSDFEFIQSLYPLIDNKIYKRLKLVDKSLNAAQMKWIISNAECNIACRTHSTIASFSTSVPTISLGYSIKSKGLNLQMYGHENYLLYNKGIYADNVLKVFNDVWARRSEIKLGLEIRNQEIKANSMLAGKYLEQLLSQRSEI